MIIRRRNEIEEEEEPEKEKSPNNIRCCLYETSYC
jgi:hypothetical protein